MTLPIAQLGQPVLRQKAREVPPEEIRTERFQEFLEQMLVTVREARGIGLAAPQVYVSKRVFVAGVLPPREEGAPPEMEVFINPTITPLSDRYRASWEGCLSFNELLVLVPRLERVRVDYLDRHGLAQGREFTGLAARVLQHENDHLDGILTIDRAPSTKFIIKASEIDAFLEDLERNGLR